MPEFVKMMFYGQPGSTKTRTVCSAALDDRTWPTLFLNIAGNPVSIRDYVRKPDIVDIENLQDFNPLYEWLSMGQPVEHPIVKDLGLMKDGPYKCLIVDQLTETQRFSLRTVTGNAMLGPGSIGKGTTQQNFGQILEQMVRFASRFFALNMHVLMCVQEKQTKDDATGAIMVAPYLWGQADVEVGSFAEVVARLVHRAALPGRALEIMEDVNDDTVSVALFQPSGKYVAKDQYYKLGNYMVDPSIPKMLDLIYGTEPKPKP